jgi:dipicolinate synthase subunit A
MDYVMIGADKRFEYLAKLLRKDRGQVFLCDTVKEAQRYLDQAYCYLLAFSLAPREQEWLLSRVKSSSVVIGGKLFGDCPRVTNGEIVYRDLSSEEEFALKNALPTAEGCLERVLALTPFVLSGTEVLVVGFGRVGKETARLFRRCGANVSVCVREGKSMEAARKGSFPVFSPEDVPDKRPWRVVINTVEKKGIVGYSLLRGCENLYLVLDLASGKANVDSDALAQQNVMGESAHGLPGKCAPETAALYYYQAICSIGAFADASKG